MGLIAAGITKGCKVESGVGTVREDPVLAGAVGSEKRALRLLRVSRRI